MGFKTLTKWPLGHSVGCRGSSLPPSSPVLGKVNGYTGKSPWDALGRQLKQVLTSSCSGSDLRSSTLSILLCTGLEGCQSRCGVCGHLSRALLAGFSARGGLEWSSSPWQCAVTPEALANPRHR